MNGSDLEAAKAFINDVFVAAGLAKQRREVNNPALEAKKYFSKDGTAMKKIANIIMKYSKVGTQSPEDFFTALLDTHSSTSIFDLNYWLLQIENKYFVPTLMPREDDWTNISFFQAYKAIAIYLTLSNVILDCSDIKNLFNMRILSLLSTSYTSINPDNHISLTELLYDYGAYTGVDWNFASNLPTARSSINPLGNKYGASTPDFDFLGTITNPINRVELSKYLLQDFINVEFVWRIPNSIISGLPIPKEDINKFIEFSNQNGLSAIVAKFPPALIEDKLIANINSLYTIEQVILSLLNDKNNIQIYHNCGFKFGPDADIKYSEYGVVFFLAHK